MKGPADRNPWLTELVGAVLSRGHAPPGNPFGPTGPFCLASHDENRELLTGAGFSDVVVEEIQGAMVFSDLESYWDLQAHRARPPAGQRGSGNALGARRLASPLIFP